MSFECKYCREKIQGVKKALIPIKKRHVRYQKFIAGTMERPEGPEFFGEPIEGYETVKEVAVCENHVEDFLSQNEVHWEPDEKVIYIPVTVARQKWHSKEKFNEFEEQ